jgi:hypothetical protein
MGRRAKFFVETPGGAKSLPQLAEEYDIKLITIRQRFERGARWPEIVRVAGRTGRPIELTVPTSTGRVTIVEHAKATGISTRVLYYRIKTGKTLEQLNTPVRIRTWDSVPDDSLYRTNEIVVLDPKENL